MTGISRGINDSGSRSTAVPVFVSCDRMGSKQKNGIYGGSFYVI
jgi:hypothetical protein